MLLEHSFFDNRNPRTIQPGYAGCAEGEDAFDFEYNTNVFNEYTKICRECVLNAIANEMGWELEESFNCSNNSVSIENAAEPFRYTVRNNAVSARSGEIIIIQGLAEKDGKEAFLIGTGKGNPDWCYTAPAYCENLKMAVDYIEKPVRLKEVYKVER